MEVVWLDRRVTDTKLRSRGAYEGAILFGKLMLLMIEDASVIPFKRRIGNETGVGKQLEKYRQQEDKYRGIFVVGECNNWDA